MQRPDVVDYLRQNLSKFRVEELRGQLLSEGVSEEDFEDSLDAALQASKTGAKGGGKPGVNAAALALGAGVLLILGVGLFAVSQKSAEPEKPAVGASGESGFVGHRGWVVRLPSDYVGVTEFKDPAKTRELVHFAKRGTDPTNFLDEGLFGQMGIVRLEVLPSPFPANPAGVTTLTNAVSRKIGSGGEKFVAKNLTVAGLSGVQINVQAPFPRVEAYLIGKRDLFFFYGGQDDDIWRDIVLSLRDMRAQD